jgi:ABC-type transport system involved in multi-copper enzyme maturation permease subunit
MLGIPVMASLGAWFLTGLVRWTPGNPPYLLFLSTTLYTLYLAYSAARLAGGSIAVERQRQGASHLRVLPISVLDIYVGKFLGSLLPLFVEVLVVCPLLIGLCLLGWGPVSSAVSLTLFLLGVIVWYGSWGMFWSARSTHVDQALNRSIMTVTIMMYVLPIAGMIFGAVANLPPAVTELGIDLNPLVCLYTTIASVACDASAAHRIPMLVGTMAPITVGLIASTIHQLRRI